MEFVIAGVDALNLFVFAVIVLVWVLVAKFIMYAFGRLRGSGGGSPPRRVADRAIQSRGCVGSMKEYDVEKRLGALVLLASSQ